MPVTDVPNASENLPTVPLALEVTESLPPTTPSDHYQISSDTHHKVQLLQWLKTNESDPVLWVCIILFFNYFFFYIIIKDFLPQLKNHFLSHLLGLRYDGDELDFTPSDRHSITIDNNIIYRHKVLRVNYMTYDM